MESKTNTPESHTTALDTKSPRISEEFHASDADVTFLSADNVLFNIHRKNLETHTGGFPPAEFDTQGEIVSLTETSETLELLFKFIYPRRHPYLDSVSFETLAPLAEAAEKYQVFSAMNICRFRMKDILPNHAAEIFNYATRHGYKEILNIAAPFLLDIPLGETVRLLSNQLVVPWVIYHEQWSQAAISAIKSAAPVTVSHCKRCEVSIPPIQFWTNLNGRRSIAALREVFTSEEVRRLLDKELEKVPAFETFL